MIKILVVLFIIGIAVGISFTSLLNDVGGVVGIARARVRGWCESSFGGSRVGRVDPQSLDVGQMNDMVELLLWFYEVLLFQVVILVSSLYSLHGLYLKFPLNSYFIISLRGYYFQKSKD